MHQCGDGGFALNLTCSGSLDPVAKKIPSSIKVDRLKQMVRRLLGIDPQMQVLSIRTYKNAPPSILDEGEATMKYYGVVDGRYFY